MGDFPDDPDIYQIYIYILLYYIYIFIVIIIVIIHSDIILPGHAGIAARPGVIRTGACTHPAPAQTTLGLEDLHVDLP
jgi:hypothetical protein